VVIASIGKSLSILDKRSRLGRTSSHVITRIADRNKEIQSLCAFGDSQTDYSIMFSVPSCVHAVDTRFPKQLLATRPLDVAHTTMNSFHQEQIAEENLIVGYSRASRNIQIHTLSGTTNSSGLEYAASRRDLFALGQIMNSSRVSSSDVS
jgi:hypothetical protein